MIDLTPLDVRKKRGDFKKGMRGYDTQEVESFLEVVADRLEDLVKETLMLRERAAMLQAQVDSQTGRERAVQDALVTAQSMRDEIKDQARREAEMIRREAEAEARRIMEDAARLSEQQRDGADRRIVQTLGELEALERRRELFLVALRRFLERELDLVTIEEAAGPLPDTTVELEFQGRAPRPGPSPDDPPRRGAGGAVKGELWLGLAEDPQPPRQPEAPDSDSELAS